MSVTVSEITECYRPGLDQTRGEHNKVDSEPEME